jgi:hypothetical protein
VRCAVVAGDVAAVGDRVHAVVTVERDALCVCPSTGCADVVGIEVQQADVGTRHERVLSAQEPDVCAVFATGVSGVSGGNGDVAEVVVGRDRQFFIGASTQSRHRLIGVMYDARTFRPSIE